MATEEVRIDFGKALQLAIRSKGYRSLASFSKQSGVPYHRLKKWSQNARSPQLRSVCLVASRLGMQPHQLIKMGEKAPESSPARNRQAERRLAG